MVGACAPLWGVFGRPGGPFGTQGGRGNSRGGLGGAQGGRARKQGGPRGAPLPIGRSKIIDWSETLEICDSERYGVSWGGPATDAETSWKQ